MKNDNKKIFMAKTPLIRWSSKENETKRKTNRQWTQLSFVRAFRDSKEEEEKERLFYFIISSDRSSTLIKIMGVATKYCNEIL